MKKSKINGRRAVTKLRSAAPNIASTQLRAHLEELSTLFVRMLKVMGFTSEQIIEEIKTVAARERPSRKKAALGNLSYWARVLARWAEDPRYTSEEGLPRDLPQRGQHPSFGSLVAEELPGADPEEGLRILLITESVMRLPSGLLRWRRRTAIGHNERILFLDEYLRPLRALLVNLEENLTQRVAATTRENFARGISGFEVSESDVVDLRRLLDTQGMMFIEMVDNWLKRRSARRADSNGGAGHLVRPYVGVFMTKDGELPTRRSGRVSTTQHRRR
jgi:hypothetical protein